MKSTCDAGPRLSISLYIKLSINPYLLIEALGFTPTSSHLRTKFSDRRTDAWEEAWSAWVGPAAARRASTHAAASPWIWGNSRKVSMHASLRKPSTEAETSVCKHTPPFLTFLQKDRRRFFNIVSTLFLRFTFCVFFWIRV